MRNNTVILILGRLTYHSYICYVNLHYSRGRNDERENWDNFHSIDIDHHAVRFGINGIGARG